jgi:hypothetical protein
VPAAYAVCMPRSACYCRGHVDVDIMATCTNSKAHQHAILQATSSKRIDNNQHDSNQLDKKNNSKQGSPQTLCRRTARPGCSARPPQWQGWAAAATATGESKVLMLVQVLPCYQQILHCYRALSTLATSLPHWGTWYWDNHYSLLFTPQPASKLLFTPQPPAPLAPHP